jgi:hypothetical protein
LDGISEFPAIILAIHCISCQFPSKQDFPAFFLPEPNVSFSKEISWEVEALIFSKILEFFLKIWVKIGRSLMDNWGKNWQLSNILFCCYRRLEIADPFRNLYSPGHSAPASKKLGGSWDGKSACL